MNNMKPMKIVCLGDSLTEGYGVETQERWSYLLEKELPFKFVNEGISGDTTGGMLARFESDVIAHAPSHLIIMGGTNDLSFNLSDGMIISNILAMTRRARHHEIEAIIGIPTPFHEEMSTFSDDQFLNGQSFSQRVSEFQRQLKIFAKEDGLPIIDFSQGMEPSLFLADGVHPSAEGHLQMMENAKIALEEIL